MFKIELSLYFALLLNFFHSILVLRTSPSLENDILRELERCLNETNDLAGFISSLRKTFKKMIS